MLSSVTNEIELSANVPAAKIKSANYMHLYQDVAWFGLLFGSTISFLAVFAARLGATTWQIGLLTAGPAVINVLFTIPVGRWVGNRPLGPAVTRAALWHRLGYLVLVPLPFLLPPEMQVWAVLVITLIMAIPGTALAVGFNAVLATTVPEEDRGLVVGRRNALLGATIMVSFLGSGWLLGQMTLQWGYAIVFALGALGAVMSTYHLWRLRLPATPQFQYRPVQDEAHPGRSVGLAGSASHRQGVALRLWLHWPPGKVSMGQFSGRYWKMMSAYFVFHFAQLLPGALFPVFWVREAQLSDSEIGWVNALFFLVMLLTSPLLGRLTRKMGNHRLNVAGAILLSVYPLLTGLATDLTLLFTAAIIGGAAWAILSGALVNRLLEFIPTDQRASHLALYNMALNLATLGGMMLGPALAGLFGLREALLIIAGLRIISGLALARWG